MKKQKFSHGFTLIELLVAIAIISLLVAILLPNFVGARQRAKDSQKIQELNSVKNALVLYYGDYQIYPATGANLNNDLKPYLTSISEIEYTYTQKDSESFTLKVDLESGSGDEDINSQTKCGETETFDKVYELCIY